MNSYLGYPARPGYPHYGLYAPQLDCFIHVNDDHEGSLDAKILIMPKCHVEVVQLDTAHNYHHNLIDNTVCEHWNWKKDSKHDFWAAHSDCIHVAEHIMPSSLSTETVVRIDEIKLLAQCVWHWCRFLQALPNLQTSWHRVRRMLAPLCPELSSVYHQDQRLIDQHKKQILTWLFFMQDTKECHAAILRYVQADPGLCVVYHEWCQGQ